MELKNKSDNELTDQEYLSILTEEDYKNKNLIENFENDKNFRQKLYYLRKTGEKLEKEYYENTFEKIYSKNIELEKNLVKLKKKFDYPDLKDIQSEILLMLLSKRKEGATEKIVEYCKSKAKIFTTRKDNGSQMYIYDKGIYIINGETYVEEICRLILEQNYNIGFVNNVKDKIKADTYIDEDKLFEQDKRYIAVNNGILNLNDKILLPFSEDLKFFTKLPVNFEPNAKCDNIIDFFKDIIEYEDDLILLQELFGYLLYKAYPIEKAFMFLGKGRNGKGQLLELIKRFVGVENCAAISLQKICDDTNFDLCDLHHKLVNIGGDIPDTFIKETGILKSLTGNDFISVRRKFLSNLNFTNYAKLIFACNKLPKSSDNSIGFWSRWILINFPYRFIDEEEFKTLNKDELKNCKLRKNDVISSLCNEFELSGLLNWALDGLDRLMDKGYFTYTTSNKNVQDRWIKASDSFASFCADNLIEEFGVYIEKDELRKQYNEYCKNNKIESVGDKAIKNYLTKELGVSEWREQNIINQRLWKNICWKKDNKTKYNFGVLSERIKESNQDIQDNYMNHIINFEKNTYINNINHMVKLDKLDNIKKLINKVPDNNQDILIDIFGQDTIDKLKTNGIIFLKDVNTYRVV